jgi:hypothetical protein
MRAFSRRLVAPLFMAAAVLTVGPAYLATGAPTVHSAALATACPPGTNWDTIKQACV